MPIQDPLISTRFIGIDADGVRRDIVVELGKPYLYGPNEWACPISLDGLHEKLRDIHGGDALQSLCLALRYVFGMLDHFQQQGGKLEFSLGESVPLESYFWLPPMK